MKIKSEKQLVNRFWFISLNAWMMLWIPIALVSYFHYSTVANHHWLHDIFRRLYYIPIILGAFSYGIKGGLLAALVSSIIYVPHAFTDFFMQDPGSPIEKLLEIALYNIVGFITGFLANREHKERLRQESIAKKLKETLDEKKVLEEQLIRSGKLQALGELTAGIAHEIKNPLASIKGAAEAIADEIDEHSPRQNLIKIQKKELDRLEKTLERFLSFARPTKVMMSKIDLCELIAHVVKLVEPQAASKSIQIVIHCESTEYFVMGDRHQIIQVLVNLILNAVDAAGKNGVIKISTRKETIGPKKYCIIDVIDNGPGVPEELTEKIFNPFFSTKDHGAGLGLSISTKIMDGHGGFMKVENLKKDSGACFSIYLKQLFLKK